MKFYVCIKQVPDVYAPLQIRDGEIQQDSDRQVLNAYDASAVEEALVLTEKHGGRVDVVLAGPEKASETIRKALAMGAEEGVHLITDSSSGSDSAAYALLLTTFFKDKEFDVLSFGKQAQDTDSGLTGAMVAQHLGLPYATNAVGLEIEGDHLIVTRQGDSGQEIIALPTPCLVTCSNDMNDPRIPTLKGIMGSKRKAVETLQASSLMDGTPLDSAALTKTLSFEDVPARKAGQKFEGDATEIAGQVAKILSEKTGVFS